MPPKRSAEDGESKTLKKQKTGTASSEAPSAAPAPNQGSLDPKIVRAKAYAPRALVYRQIKKQMKWVPSCRRGTARFSYTSSVQNADVFFRMFRLEPTDAKGKKWKQKKMPVGDFESCIGQVEASIRYGSLRIMGPYVNLKWDEEDNMFTVSGKHGLSQLRSYSEE